MNTPIGLTRVKVTLDDTKSQSDYVFNFWVKDTNEINPTPGQQNPGTNPDDQTSGLGPDEQTTEPNTDDENPDTKLDE